VIYIVLSHRTTWVDASLVRLSRGRGCEAPGSGHLEGEEGEDRCCHLGLEQLSLPPPLLSCCRRPCTVEATATAPCSLLILQEKNRGTMNPIYLYFYDSLSHSLDMQDIHISIQSCHATSASLQHHLPHHFE
jgi:hypothetical protein